MPYIGKPCRASHSSGPVFDLMIDSVQENPRAKRPQDIRSPFSVLLTGPLEPSFQSGILDLELGGMPFLHGVCLLRIAPPWGLNPEKAYYQIVFN